MRIAIDMVGTNSMSGTRSYNINFCENLIQKEIKQEIILFISKNYKKNLKNSKNKNIRYVVKPDFLSITWLRIIWMQFFLPFELKSLKVSKLYSPMNLAPILIKIFKIKSILTVHTNLPWVDFTRMPGTFFRKIMVKFLMEISINKSDELIVNSIFAKKELVKCLELKNKKIHVVYLGVSKKYKNSGANKNYIKNFNYDNYILSVLSCAKYHNIINLIKAFQILKERNNNNLRFILVTQVLDHNYFLEIKTHIKNNNLEQNIFIMHNLESKYLLNLYKYAKLYLFSSYHEVFGLTSLEAMAQGCPVLISEKSALKEVNGKAAKYFNPDNPVDIANQAIKVLTNKQIKNNLKKISRSHIKRFSWDKTVQRTLQILSS